MKSPKIFLTALIIALMTLSTACQKESKPILETSFNSNLPLDSLILPEGFQISTYVEDIDGARSMAMGDQGTLFVSTRKQGKVYALVDRNHDYRADSIYTIAKKMKMPNGIAFKNGSLYVADVDALYRYDQIESNLSNPPEPILIYDDYPKEQHHGWKYIAFGPDGKLYVPVGAPCNICDEAKNDSRFASITRMDPDGTNREIFAHGVRNTVGFTWHPETNEMWFTDNGRDLMGDDLPPCELNHATEFGQHFGYPYRHATTVIDPEYGDMDDCLNCIPPVQDLDAHVAPLGLTFYRGSMFPIEYQDYIFIAEHGSWNRSKKSGYRIMKVKLDGNKAVSYTPFIEGWLNHDTQKRWGRPVDILVLDDGSMLISDDFGDAIYRVTYAH